MKKPIALLITLLTCSSPKERQPAPFIAATEDDWAVYWEKIITDLTTSLNGMKNYFLVILFASGVVFSYGQRQEQVSILKMENRILDGANLLNADQKKSIFEVIQALEKSVGSQIGIVTITSLNGQPIHVYSRDKANLMKLGRKSYKDGILIVFALNDGLLRTEVGAGLDQIITNEVSAKINEAIIAPQFRSHNYAQGFYNGVKALKERIEKDRNLIGK